MVALLALVAVPLAVPPVAGAAGRDRWAPALKLGKPRVRIPAAALSAPVARPGAPGTITAADALRVGPAREGGRALLTADGRRVLLRGANVAALVDYGGAHGTVAVTAADGVQARALGINVVRLGVSWSRIQPRPGVTDRGYLAEIERAARVFADRGIYVLLDMHHDRYAANLGQPSYVESDGAPAWAVDTAGTSCSPLVGNLQGLGRYYTTPCAAKAAEAFWEDRTVAGRSLQGAYADAVSAATATGRRIGPAFAGVELYNEPVSPDASWPPSWATQRLFPFYAKLVARLRRDGYGGPVWFEGFGPEAARFAADGQLVYSPHIYTDVFSGDVDAGTEGRLDAAYRDAQRMATAFGAALVPGEFPGAGGGNWEAYRRWQLRIQDRDLTGGIIWIWKQHPTKDYGWGVLNPDGGLRSGSRSALDLGRPRVVAARPRIVAQDADDDRLTVRTSGAGTVELWTGAATGSRASRGAAPTLTIDGRAPSSSIDPVTVRASAALPGATIGGRRVRVTLPAGAHTLRLRP